MRGRETSRTSERGGDREGERHPERVREGRRLRGRETSRTIKREREYENEQKRWLRNYSNSWGRGRETRGAREHETKRETR